jgi:molybdopterin adenylyltransferase
MDQNSTITVGIVTISDTRAAGTRADTTTTLIHERITATGMAVACTELVPDVSEQIQSVLVRMSDAATCQLIVTTGGTGLSPRDVTPEATRAVIEREVPGLAEAMRAETAKQNAFAWLSRGVAGIRNNTLIINLPGSPTAVGECLDVIMPVLPHAIDTMCGVHHA